MRLGLAALGVLVVTGLGLATADLLGLSEVAHVAAEGDPLLELSPGPEEQPGMRRTVGLDAVPAIPPPAPESAAPPAATSPQLPPVAAHVEAPAPDSEARRAPSPVRTVRTGTSCSDVGRTGLTAKGEAAVCTASRGNGKNKWRAA